MAPARTGAEYALRALAISALALAACQRVHPAPPRPPSPEHVDARAGTGALPAALARWTAVPVSAAHVAFDTLPGAPTRAWLAALAAAGTRVTWQAAHAPTLAAAAERVVDPAGGVRVDAVAPDGALLAVADALGPLDSARAAAGGATFRLVDAGPGLTVHAAGAAARLATPPPLARLGAALVIARAGWEGKFTAAALQERGWTVRTRFAVDPDVVVTAAAAPRLDTSAVAVVVALDSSAASLAPATPALAPVDDSVGALRPLERSRADAVPLAWCTVAGTRTLVAAARRVGAGRVVQVADEATWRRRMRPDDAAPAAHRAWWAQVVAAAAYVGAPRPAATGTSAFGPLPTDPAPLAATVAALGAPSKQPPLVAWAASTSPSIPDSVLIPVALLALLGEVASRRLRGTA